MIKLVKNHPRRKGISFPREKSLRGGGGFDQLIIDLDRSKKKIKATPPDEVSIGRGRSTRGMGVVFDLLINDQIDQTTPHLTLAGRDFGGWLATLRESHPAKGGVGWFMHVHVYAHACTLHVHLHACAMQCMHCKMHMQSMCVCMCMHCIAYSAVHVLCMCSIGPAASAHRGPNCACRADMLPAAAVGNAP